LSHCQPLKKSCARRFGGEPFQPRDPRFTRYPVCNNLQGDLSATESHQRCPKSTSPLHKQGALTHIRGLDNLVASPRPHRTRLHVATPLPLHKPGPSHCAPRVRHQSTEADCRTCQPSRHPPPSATHTCGCALFHRCMPHLPRRLTLVWLSIMANRCVARVSHASAAHANTPSEEVLPTRALSHPSRPPFVAGSSQFSWCVSPRRARHRLPHRRRRRRHPRRRAKTWAAWTTARSTWGVSHSRSRTARKTHTRPSAR
jgi:hypothetical protein